MMAVLSKNVLCAQEEQVCHECMSRFLLVYRGDRLSLAADVCLPFVVWDLKLNR